MQSLRAGAAAIAIIAFAATGCATKPDNSTLENSAAWAPVITNAPALETHLAALNAAPFSMKATTVPDIDAIIAALPQQLGVTYEGATTDASGATVLTGVRLAPAMLPTVGVSVAELKLWGLDGEFAVARLQGQRLEEQASLARRIEASNITLFGLETVVTPLLAMAAASGDEDLAGLSFDSYNFSIGKIVYDDLVLRPFTMEAKTLDVEDVGQYFPIFQQVIAANRSIAADTVATYDMDANFIFSIDGVANSGSFGMDLAGSRGVRGGDVDQSVGRGFHYNFDLPSAAENGGAPLKMDVSLDSFSTNGLRLDKVFDHIARGEMPDRNMADLMSLGVSRYANQRVSMNGAEVYSVGDTEVDLSNFHWFIPTKARFSTSNAVYDVAGMADMIQQAEGDAFNAEDAEMLKNVLAAMETQGLDKPSFDGVFAWDWNAASGATAFDIGFGVDDFMRFSMKFDGALPDFNSVSNLIPNDLEQTDEAALQELFTNRSSFSNFTFDIVDEGGLDKGFALAIDIAKLAPEDDSTAAMLRNATPEGLRQMASSMLFIGAAALAEEMPAAQQYVTILANFINQGGALHLAATPPAPLGVAQLAALEDSEPEQILEMVGLSLTHEAPAQEQAAK